MRLILKRRKNCKTLALIMLIIILFISSSILFIKYYSEKATPIIIDYSRAEIKRLMYLVINDCVNESNSKMDVNDLFIVRYNSNGEIVLIDFDSKKSSKILYNYSNLIETNLKKIEEGNVDKYRDYYNSNDFKLLQKGIIVMVPFGVCFSSSFLNNLGPKVPVRLSFTRNVETNFNTEVVSYGLNNALLKLNINVVINAKVILPIVSDNIDFDFSIPIAMKVIQGKIPSYYMDGFNSNSNVVRDG